MPVSAPVGVASFFANGEAWNVTKSSCRASVPKREILDSQTTVGDYSEKPQAGHISITVRPGPGQDVTFLQNLVSCTCTLTERSGVIWYGAGLTQTGEGEYDTAEGTVELKFEGSTVTRQFAS